MFRNIKSRRLLAVAAVTAAVGVSLLATAGPASAHVEVDDGTQPAKGGYGIVRLIVPTESTTASTVGLAVTIPNGVDLPEVSTLAVPGWTATVVKDGSRVTRITWQAVDKSGGIKPSEFGEFTFSAGPWPGNVNTVSLPTDQTYSDGSVVAWNEIAVDKDSEPEHPAPTLTLSASSGGHDHADSDADPGATAASPAPEATAAPLADHHAGSTQAAAAGGGGESRIWQITSVASLVIALGTAAALIVVLRRTRGEGS